MPKYERPSYFPLYPNDFTSDGKVEAMSTREVGAYFLLICKAWAETPPASIPDDDDILSRWTRLSIQEWRDCKEAVLKAWVLRKDGRYHQKRLRAEFDKILKLMKTKSNSGKKGAKIRWCNAKKGKEINGSAIADPMRQQCQSESESEKDLKKDVCISRAGPIDWHLPEYQELRSAALEILHGLNAACGKRYPDSYHGIKVIVERLKEGRPPDQFAEIVRKKLLDTDFNRNYLRPETLFAAENFEKYLYEDEREYGKRNSKAPRRKARFSAGDGDEYPDDTPR